MLGAPLPSSLTLIAASPEAARADRARSTGAHGHPPRCGVDPSRRGRARSAPRWPPPAPSRSGRRRVLDLGGRVLASAGRQGLDDRAHADRDDGTTVRELGLDLDQVRPVGGLLSAPLALPAALTAPAPQVAVTIGPVGPRTIAVCRPLGARVARGRPRSTRSQPPILLPASPRVRARRRERPAARAARPGRRGDRRVPAHRRRHRRAARPRRRDARTCSETSPRPATARPSRRDRRRRRRLGELPALRAAEAAADLRAERTTPAASTRRSSLRSAACRWQEVAGSVRSRPRPRRSTRRAPRTTARPCCSSATGRPARRCRPATATSSPPTASAPAWPDACGAGTLTTPLDRPPGLKR